MSIVVVNQTEIHELVSRGQRVVTYEMVASVHSANIEAVRKSYKSHAEYFEDGIHTWILQGEELQALRNSGTLSTTVKPASLRVFTELGYYLLIKPMRDATAWQVQKEMANTYFAVKHNLIEKRSEPAQLTPQAQIDTIKSAYEFLLDFGLADDQSKVISREKVHNIIASIGSQDAPNLLPQHSASQYFQVEELLDGFNLTSKFRFDHRGQIGKVVRTAIQLNDEDCNPHKVKKYVNGAEREVNMWPIEYRDIAVAAIERYIERVSSL